MKRSVIIAALGCGALTMAHGQGSVNFANNIGPTTTGITFGNGPDQGLGVSSQCLVTLLYGASSDTAISQLTALSYSDTSGDQSPVNAGLLGHPANPGAVSTATGCGFYNGGSVFISAAGTSFAFAVEAQQTLLGNVYTGYSGIQVLTVATGLQTPPNLTSLQSFTISEVLPVPEPSSLALAGLGGFGMLMAFRRKKA